MITYSTTFINTDGNPFPNTKTVNASGAGTGDGTELTKPYGDNLWGITQALLDAAGLTPDNVTEAPGTSQILEAIRKISGSPGEGVIWWKNSDPAVTGDRVLLLNGQGILRANYPELDAAVYVGDGNNPTASAFYRANDAGGAVRNIVGIYLILPDTRGYVLRGLDVAAGVDPDGASRDVGSIQSDAMQKTTGNFQILKDTLFGSPVITPSQVLGVFSSGNGTSVNGRIDTTVAGLLATQKITFDNSNSTLPNTAKTNDIETRMINVATKYGIRY